MTIAKVLACRDMGADCSFVARAQTEEEIFKQATEHAQSAHNMNEVPPDLAEKARTLIRDE
ncbi:MAG: DUF1059 domain-containing protein [Candidatus Methylomirabilia bacterium]